jgi:hypothetical protein
MQWLMLINITEHLLGMLSSSLAAPSWFKVC